MDRRINGEFLPTCLRTREEIKKAEEEVKENEHNLSGFSTTYFVSATRISRMDSYREY